VNEPGRPPSEAGRRVATAQPGDQVWHWGLEADPARQLRRVRGLLTGRSGKRLLRDAVGGRRILVTGASAGIGRETALRLGRGGAELLIVARRRPRLEELAGELSALGANAHVMPCDLSDVDAVEALAAQVLAEHGGVDVLVNNAGHSIRRSLRNSTDRLHDFERVMRLNYFGIVALTLPLLDEMRQRGSGHVVNVSTLGTQFGPEPRFTAYLGSKGALDAFTRSAAAETHRDGVLWTTVHMPLVRTEMIAPTKAYRGVPAMSVAQAADMVVDAVVRRPARVSHPFGVATQLFDLAAPRQLERIMGSRMRRVGVSAPAEDADDEVS